MKRINLIFGIHCHQPVGNFDSVFQMAYKKSYLPFIQILSRHPSIKMVLHYSGCLLEWIEQKRPEFIAMLKELVDRGQVEMMTGGFYEPIMPIIPDRDKIGQIEMLTDYIKDRFGYEARGMWLPERVWEPHLSKPLAEAGIKYVALDDYHFKSAGFNEEELYGYFNTEEQGYVLSIFPISERLRYGIPFKLPEFTIDYLRDMGTENDPTSLNRDRLSVIVDDGEKFGLWPKTYDWVYKEKWLEKFFCALEENSDWINTTTFSDFTDKHPASGRAYLPTASYFEMSQWTLPSQKGAELEDIVEDLKDKGEIEKYKVFLKGGFWRGFLAKYDESNNMHKKMLSVSRKVDLKGEGEAISELWKGQCNCAYWHGVFGGLYLPHLRDTVYRHLIRAERISDEEEKGSGDWIESEELDFDGDGKDEIILSNGLLNLYLDPSYGGSLFELDYKPRDFNLVNTLSRRPESYHRDIIEGRYEAEVEGKQYEGPGSIHDLAKVTEEGIERYLKYDWYNRVCFLDHFLGEGTSLEGFKACEYQELGDFVNQPYLYDIKDQNGGKEVSMRRDGGIYGQKKQPLTVSKKLKMSKSNAQVDVRYVIENPLDADVELWFGVEFNFSFLSGEGPARHYEIRSRNLQVDLKDCSLGSTGAVEGIDRIDLDDDDRNLTVSLKFDRKTDVWRFPVETVSQSEKGFERTYQSSVVFPNWKIGIGPKDRWECNFEFCVLVPD